MLATNLRRFKVITFDCTNTILFFKNPPEIQYVKVCENCVAEHARKLLNFFLKTAAEHGIPSEVFDKDLLRVNFRKEFKELQKTHPNFGERSIKYEKWWQQLVINVLTQSSREAIDPKLLEPVAKKLIGQYQTRECWGKFPKSNELINGLKDAGKTVGVISNFDPRLHYLLNDVNLPPFDFVATSYEAGAEKPHPDIFKYAAKISRQQFEPQEALHIGNESGKDFDGAKSAGWSALLINSEAKTEPYFKNIEEFWNAITSNEVKL